jgi:hypothetical protein
MGVARLTKGSIFCSLALVLTTVGCGERPVPKKGDVTAADVVAGAVQVSDHFESPEGKFAVDFPPTWKGNYIAVAHPDTAFGSRLTVDFRFKPDPSWKLEPRTLLVVRIFTPAAWAKIAVDKHQSVGFKLAERGDDVFVLSVAGSNPYKAGTPAAMLFEKMMLSAINPIRLRVTPL